MWAKPAHPSEEDRYAVNQREEAEEVFVLRSFFSSFFDLFDFAVTISSTFSTSSRLQFLSKLGSFPEIESKRRCPALILILIDFFPDIAVLYIV
jgi:hypothetical protein